MLSASASAVNYIKTLAGNPGIRLHVTDADPYCPGLYDRGVIPAWLPRARETGAYRAALDRLLVDRGIDVLIPTSDYDVEAVVDYLHDGWSPKPRLFRPPWRALHDLSSKERLMARVGDALPHVVPRTWRSGEATAGIPHPVVVKPIAESGGKGVSIVHRSEDLPAALARATALYEEAYVVQEFVPGRTYVVTLVYDQVGRLVVAVPMRSNLTFFTWGGGGCAGELVDAPELQHLSHAVIEACGGWCGPINLEWRHHSETGGYYLMEANCRLNGYSYLTTMNGLSLPRVVLSLLLESPLPPLDLPPSRSRRNFVLGYRETAVDRWIVDPG
ncbi:MAG TPA: ATP-grasp domain-containing protein [Stellaceae bacterium]|nr:ATP-grasp domain-containing protein [Stellaceae bacterium]